jgi:DNA-binding transcriptional ArsR family regulator
MKFLKIHAGSDKLILKHKCLACFRALSVPARMRIFEYIKKKGKANVTSLVNHSVLRQPTVTFHLNKLVKAGIVDKKKAGREVYLQIRKVCPNCFIFTE